MQTKLILEILNLAISALILFAAIIGFVVTIRATRTQTSMEFFSTVYPILQSQEFRDREQYLLRELSKEGHKICAIEDIENEILRQEIYTYCECMNGIGILVQEHMIKDGVIIPYIGVNSIYIYRKIKPYLYMTRQKRALQISPELSANENKKIQNAAELYYVHYELLVLEMEKQGEKWTKEFKGKLNKYK